MPALQCLKVLYRADDTACIHPPLIEGRLRVRGNVAWPCGVCNCGSSTPAGRVRPKAEFVYWGMVALGFWDSVHVYSSRLHALS